MMTLRILFLLIVFCHTCIPASARALRYLPYDYDFFQELSGQSLSSLNLQYDIDMSKYQTVTRQFGPNVIDMTALPYNSPMLDSGRRAWSSWWFQKSRREFTEGGQNAILAKYDRVFGLNGKPGSAWAEERSMEKPNYATWEGLCDAWAMASLFYPEPKRPVTVGREKFSINDLKGLVIKSFEAVPDTDLALYGEKFLGSADAWIFPDVFPDQFHRFVEIILGQHHKGFVMDRDPGVEVWSVPIYKANYRVEKNPAVANGVIVKMWLFGAGTYSFDRRDSSGTDEIVYQYAYELSGDLSSDQKQLTVTGGKWIRSGFVDSRSNHPDFLLLPKSDHLTRTSYNRNVDPAKIDRIVKGSL